MRCTSEQDRETQMIERGVDIDIGALGDQEASGRVRWCLCEKGPMFRQLQV